MESKNSQILISFNNYCLAHPDKRFWQALRDWSGQRFILTADKINFPDYENIKDTFYWDGKNKA